MARTDIPVTPVVANGGMTVPAGVAVDPANGHSISCGGQPGRVIIYLNNTFAGTKVVTLKAGPNPPAFRKDEGDVTYTAAASAVSLIGPFESARVNQAAGLINVDLAAGVTGTIAALFLPTTV